MKMKSPQILFLALAVAAFAALPNGANAAPPAVKTVPWVPSNPLIPHDTWSGKLVTLKGATDVQGATIQWTWDFGDGSPAATGAVSDMYVVEATHAYSGVPGTIFTARLTIQNLSTGESASKEYFVAMRTKTLDVEVNVAIDEGLWYLHKTQYRSATYDHWAAGSAYGGYASSGFFGVTAANVNAFEVNGHLESGDPSNPYTETVREGLKTLFVWLTWGSIAGSQTNGLGTFNPDANGNGIGVYVNQSYPFYQGGMFIDAIVATGTPNAIASDGPTNVIGRKYKDIVQDMVDLYSYCQYDSSGGGGWRYNCNEFPDNSVGQWAAIGLIAAERSWGIVIPQIVKDWNRVWLAYTQDPAVPTVAGYGGAFGYTAAGYYPWGPYATTPSGMVQMAMDGVGRGTVTAPLALNWDNAESFMRNNFGNCCGPYTDIRDYYYGLFSFVKSLLLHDSNGDGIAEPIHLLQSSTPGVNPIDWYAAEISAGDPADGVARTLVNDQSAAGYWYGHAVEGNQYLFETAWAIIMLNRTVFTAGAPVAVASAAPNPALAGQTIALNGGSSFHQDASKSIVNWEWDFDNNGTYDATGAQVTTSFAALGIYPVKLRVTDNGAPPASAVTTLNVLVTIPPVAPTANAGGPYSFCPNRTWFLDGSKSVNPDTGNSEPGHPPDFLKLLEWDLDGNGAFNDASGAQPNVTAFFTAAGPGSYLVQLKATDNTALSFPSSGLGDLFSIASAQVYVRAPTDPACGCITNLVAYPKNSLVQLTWPAFAGTDHYNIYRGTVSGGPYLFIGTVPGTDRVYFDRTVTNGVTYYYMLRPAAANGTELCQSNEVSARPRALR